MSLPKIIQEENDPVKLRAYMYFMADKIEELQRQNDKLNAEKAKADQKLLKLDDQLLTFKKRMFGRASERRVSERYRIKREKQLTLQGASLAPAPTKEEQQKLDEVKIDHELTSEELADIAEEYGYPRDSEWEHISGLYDESTEVDVVVQSYVRKKHIQHKYRLKATKGTDHEVIVSAPAPAKIVKGSKYSPEFAVDVVANKFLYHVPLERIRRKMESAGLTIATNTLYALTFFVSMYLESIAKRIKQEILTCGLALHIDETKWPINNKRENDGYMWVMSNQAGSFYQFEPTRAGAVAKELLGPYRGPVVTDGYAGYKAQYKDIGGVTLAFCWAHVRRKFTDIEKNYPKECGEILDMLHDLFMVERRAKSYEELKRLRETESKTIIAKIEAWLMDQKPKARTESYLHKAIVHTMNHWEGLTKFLDDIKIPLSNNEVERAIRPSVLGRKNFHGSRTINGADTASVLYTIIESCKKVELDPRSYILMAVTESIKGAQAPTPLQYARQSRKNTVKTG